MSTERIKVRGIVADPVRREVELEADGFAAELIRAGTLLVSIGSNSGMPELQAVPAKAYRAMLAVHVDPAEPPPPPKTSFKGTCTVTTLEPDDEFRKRLLYVAAGDRRNLDRLSVARGAELDAIADEFGLRRRKGDEVERSEQTFKNETLGQFVEELTASGAPNSYARCRAGGGRCRER